MIHVNKSDGRGKIRENGNARGTCYIRELAAAVIVIERETAVADDEQIRFPVVIEIAGDGADRRAAEPCAQRAGLVCNIGEFATIITK